MHLDTGGAPVPPAEFKEAEENLDRVIQRETPKAILKCRVNNEVLYTHTYAYTINKKKK